MNLIQKLRQLEGEITGSGDGLTIVDAWTTVGRLLPRATPDQAKVKRVLEAQDAAGLTRLLDEIENPGGGGGEAPPEATHQEMKDAMHAFRKRLKLARLNDESRLGGRYTSGGKRSQIDAVEAPREYPERVWRALVHAGKLRDAGQGFYSDAEDRPRI